MLEYLDLDMEVKAGDVQEDGTFSGLLAVFGNVDLVGDRIVEGAFAASLKKRPASKVRLLWQHNSDQPIGKYTDLQETAKGLAFQAKLTRGVRQADEAYLLLKDGAIDSKSIGYRADPKKQEYVKEGGRDIRLLKELDLREGSLVTFPANERAVVTRVKADEEAAQAIREATTVRELEHALRDAGFVKSVAAYLAGRHRFETRDEESWDDFFKAANETEQMLKGA